MSTATARETLEKIAESANSQFFELSDVITGILCSLLARQNILLVGLPGTAKSAIVEFFGHSITCNFFSVLMHRQQPVEEIFGAMSPSRLIQQDEFLRNPKNRLPEADIAFLDEVGRASPTVLGTMLKAINERTWENGGLVQKIPLTSAIMASNSLMLDEENQAFMQRLVWKLFVNDPQEDASWQKALDMEGEPQIIHRLDIKELHLMQAEVAKLPFPQEAKDLLITIKSKLKDENIRLSMRRARQVKQMLRAFCYLSGEEIVTSEHFEVVSHALWDDPKDIPLVRKTVLDIAKPSGAKITEIVDKARKSSQSLGAPPITGDINARTAFSSKILAVKDELKGFKEELQKMSGIQNSQKLTKAIAQVASLEKDIIKQFQTFMGMGGT